MIRVDMAETLFRHIKYLWCSMDMSLESRALPDYCIPVSLGRAIQTSLRSVFGVNSFYFANGTLRLCLCKPMTLFVQNVGSFTATESTMVTYNFVISVGISTEAKTRFVEAV